MAFHSIILQYSLAGLSLFSYFLFCLVCVALEDKEECSCSRAVQSFGRQQRSCFFSAWCVQCWAKRVALNLIEFIQLNVWRSFDSLALKDFMMNLTTPTWAARLQNSTAFVLKLFSGEYVKRSVRELASHSVECIPSIIGRSFNIFLWKID